MMDFFDRLMMKSLAPVDAIRPRLPSPYERPDVGSHDMRSRPYDALSEGVIVSQWEGRSDARPEQRERRILRSQNDGHKPVNQESHAENTGGGSSVHQQAAISRRLSDAENTTVRDVGVPDSPARDPAVTQSGRERVGASSDMQRAVLHKAMGMSFTPSEAKNQYEPRNLSRVETAVPLSDHGSSAPAGPIIGQASRAPYLLDAARVSPVRPLFETAGRSQPSRRDARYQDAPPTVQVTIGRIEVRAASQPKAVKPSTRSGVSAMTLDDYLRRREKGT